MPRLTLSPALALALAATPIVGACEEPQNGGEAAAADQNGDATRKPEEAAEAVAWRRFASAHRGNRYVPRLYRKTPSQSGSKRRLQEFRDYRIAREAVLRNSASETLLDSYSEDKLDDLEQRAYVLQFLERRLARSLYPSHEQQLRLQGMQHELALLKRQADSVRRQRSTLKRQPRKAKRRAHESEPQQATAIRRPRSVCLVDSYGLVRCVVESRLSDAFMSGHWEGGKWRIDATDEARAYDVVHRLDYLDFAWEAQAQRNTRVGCQNGAWLSVDTYGPGAREASDPALPSTTEMRWMLWACRSFGSQTRRSTRQSVPGSAAGLGGSDPGWTRSTIELLQRELEACKDDESGSATIEARSKPGAVNVLAVLSSELPNAAKRATRPQIEAARDRATALQARMRALREERIAAELEASAVDQTRAAKGAEIQALAAKQRAEQAAARTAVDAAVPAGRGQAPAAPTQPEGAAGEERAPSPDELEKTANAAVSRSDDAWRKARGATRRAKAVAKRARRARAQARTVAKRAGIDHLPPPPQLGVLPGADCASRRRHFDWFTRRCDGRNGWERPGDLCHDLLRRKQRCFDGASYARSSQEWRLCEPPLLPDSSLLAQRCKARSAERSVAEGVDSACDSRDAPLAKMTGAPEPCRDPGQPPPAGSDCRVARAPPPAKGQASLPSPDLIALGPVQVLDGFGLQGLGLPDSPHRPKP
ncbi:MAG: hypothetical protein MJD61_05050 [Proteobacteria bacterium]|nr:hypothetical protein [Pseudomonadota bacterium]